MCLAQGHKAVTPVRLESATPGSHVKHSTTEPLHSHLIDAMYNNTCSITTRTCFDTKLNPEESRPRSDVYQP